MQQRVLLSDIPPETQKKYGLETNSVEATASGVAYGGGFTFTNSRGERVSVDAVELLGTGIVVHEYE